MTGKSIGCPADDGRACPDFEVTTADELDLHLSAFHGVSYEEAVGNVLSQAECDELGLDGRDGTGVYTLASLTALQRAHVWATRARSRA